MKYRKNIIILLICLLLLGGTVVSVVYISNYNKPKFANYDLDASDSKHYVANEKVNISNESFIYKSHQLLSITETKSWKLDVEIDDDAYQLLHDGYTFMLAKDDQLLLDTNCDYKDGSIILIDFLAEQNRDFNQIVIRDNGNFKILVTIDLKVQ